MSETASQESVPTNDPTAPAVSLPAGHVEVLPLPPGEATVSDSPDAPGSDAVKDTSPK